MNTCLKSLLTLIIVLSSQCFAHQYDSDGKLQIPQPFYTHPDIQTNATYLARIKQAAEGCAVMEWRLYRAGNEEPVQKIGIDFQTKRKLCSLLCCAAKPVGTIETIEIRPLEIRLAFLDSNGKVMEEMDIERVGSDSCSNSRNQQFTHYISLPDFDYEIFIELIPKV